jgi:hypothetical protein
MKVSSKAIFKGERWGVGVKPMPTTTKKRGILTLFLFQFSSSLEAFLSGSLITRDQTLVPGNPTKHFHVIELLYNGCFNVGFFYIILSTFDFKTVSIVKRDRLRSLQQPFLLNPIN